MGGLMYELAPAAAGVLLAITIALAARLIMYRREIARLSRQLREFCDDADRESPQAESRDLRGRGALCKLRAVGFQEKGRLQTEP